MNTNRFFNPKSFSSFRVKSNCALVFSVVIFLLTLQPLNAQLDTLHYLPPFHGLSSQVNLPREQYVHLSTTSTQNVAINIYRGDGALLTTAGPIIISRTSSSTYLIGNDSMTQTYVIRDSLCTVLKSRGLILRGTAPFYANFRCRGGSSYQQAEMVSCQGMAATGTVFRAGVAPIFAATENRSFFISLMATRDTTMIKISGYNPNVVFAAPGSSTLSSDSLSIVLYKGQSYVLSGYSQLSAANLDGFTGALIRSDKPIVVNNGNWTGTIQSLSDGQDIMANQAVPIERIGTEYVCIRGNGLDSMEQPMVIAHYNNTQVFVAGSSIPIATLNAGQYFFIPESNYSGTSHESMYIRTSLPAYLYQPLGGYTDERNAGMNFIPPISCLLPLEAVIPDVNTIGNFPYSGDMVILTKQNSVVSINSIVQTGAQSITGLVGWETYRIDSATGLADIQSTGPMSAALFGYDGAASYAGYYSGFGTAPGIRYVDGQDIGSCLPVLLEAVPTGNQYQWLLNDSVVSPSTTNPFFTATTSGNYEVVIIGTNGICIDTTVLNTSVTVFPSPNADFSANPTTVSILNPYVQFIDQSKGDPVSWTWNFGDPTALDDTAYTPVTQYIYPDEYSGIYPVTLTITNEYGCMDSITLDIIVRPDFTFFIPNSFTPNGDGINDTFFGNGTGISQYELMIFDRWGMLIFSSNNLNTVWDGKHKLGGNEICMQDVYVWKVALTDNSGKKQNYTGHVTLIR